MSNPQKVFLFTTRFIEQEGKLFSEINTEPERCLSSEYYDYFFSNDLPKSIVDGMNNRYNRAFFLRFCRKNKLVDENGCTLIKVEDDIECIKNKLWGLYSKDVKKYIWLGFWGKLKSQNTISYILKENSPENKNSTGNLPFDINNNEKRIIHSNSYKRVIQEIEHLDINNMDTLNTDFGGISEDKKTIDRRFKIYKLRTKADGVEIFKDVPVFGVWCLGKPDNETVWYGVLYQEIKAQMGGDFKNDLELFFFLHDGDVGERIPFKVINYKTKKDKFDFLNDKQTLSVSIFQHSLSPISDALSTSDIDKALGIAEESMTKGGKISFLNELSDYVAFWQKGGKEKYEEIIDEARELYDIRSLISKEDIDNGATVEDVRVRIEVEIDNLHHDKNIVIL